MDRVLSTSAWRSARRPAIRPARRDRPSLRLTHQSQSQGRLPAFRASIEKYGDLLYRTLQDGGALAACRFGRADGADAATTIAGADDLSEWSEGKSFEIACDLPPDAPLLTGDALAGEILLTFDRLLPAYACAVEDDPLPFLASRAGADCGCRYSEADFHRGYLPVE